MWWRIDDDLHSHTKAVAAGDAALGLWVRLGSRSAKHGTGGRIASAIASAMASDMAKLSRLVDVGLLDQDDDGGDYWLHDWDEYNPTADEAAALKKKRSEAGKLGARRRWGTPDDDGKRHGKTHSKRNGKRMANGIAKRCPVPVPDPDLNTQTRARGLPKEWQPSQAHRDLATSNGIDLDLSVVAFRGHYDGKRCKSWNGRFATWLANEIRFARERAQRAAKGPKGSYRRSRAGGGIVRSDADGNELCPVCGEGFTHTPQGGYICKKCRLPAATIIQRSARK